MNLKGRHFLTLKDYTPEEIAYLLDGGSGEARNVWTQDSENARPVIGTPRVNKVTAVQDSYLRVTLGKAGTSMDNESVYAVSGETILINVTVSSDDREVVDSYTTSTSGDGGTWYYMYEVYEGPALYAIDVNYMNGDTVVNFENVYDVEYGSDGSSFVMAQSNDARVLANHYEGRTTELVKSWFEPKEEPVIDPEPSAGSGGGKGGGTGNGNGSGTGGGTQPGDDKGNGNQPPGTDPNPNPGTSINPPQTTLPVSTAIDSTNTVAVAIPVPEAAPQAETPQEPEAAAEVPDSGGGGETEEVEEEIIEEQEVEDMTIFEVIQKTMEENPFIYLLLLLIILILIMIGGYSRYRRSRDKRMFK